MEIQPQYHHDKTHVLSLDQEQLWLPSNDPIWHVFPRYSNPSLDNNGSRLLVFSLALVVATDKTRYGKLIAALRTAIENGEGVLDKVTTSLDDLFDSFRLTLMFWH